VAVMPVPAAGFTLRRRHYSEWRREMELARSAIPAGVQRLQPVRAAAYRLDLDHRDLVGRWWLSFVHFQALHDRQNPSLQRGISRGFLSPIVSRFESRFQSQVTGGILLVKNALLGQHASCGQHVPLWDNDLYFGHFLRVEHRISNDQYANSQ